MAECPGGRTNRGIRTQFRLGTPGLGLFKGLYPIHVRDIMDAEQSSKAGVSSATVSPCRGTKTLTVREYEETIHKLERENFDIKLRLHFYETKDTSKGKSGSSSEKDTVQIFLDLKLEAESLRKNLAYKEKVLQDTLQRAEKYELDLKELEDKYAKLQNELSSLSERPSKKKFQSLLDEKENLLKQNELLEQTLIEKDQEIEGINEKIEILANQNTLLEEKVRKRSLAIQSFVYKNVKEEEMFPEELRNIVYSATQAAKNQNKDGLVVAVKRFSSALNKVMSSSVNMLLNESEEKENIERPRAKCLKEEFLEKSSAFLPSQTETFTELSHIEALKDALLGRNTSSCKEYESLDSTVHDSYVRGKILNESTVNVSEKDILEFLTFSPECTQSVKEEKPILPSRYSSQLHSAGENLIDIETVSLPSVSSDLRHQDGLSKSEVSLLSNNSEEYQLIKENERLKCEIKEKLRVIEDLRATCNELKLRSVHFQKRDDDALKASKCYSTCTQTDIAGSNLLKEYEKTTLQKDAKLSNNVDELREDILLLLLAIEDKNKELVDIKQTLATVQEDLNKALNMSNNIIDKDYMNERNELHERLAVSSSVNIELMKQLRNLEGFMEDLLQHKFDSSIESLNEKSDFLSNVSRCLNESLKLTNVLSDHLSICEGSKLFEECESILYRSSSYCDSKSLPELNVSERTIPARHSSSYPGTRHLEEYVPFVSKKDEGMSKELDSSQLCWRCWQQLNSFPENKLDDTNLQQVFPPKCMPYASSDSDIWSEPDRNVSMQRIGISLQNSPVTSKSPRKLRLKEKRMPNKLSSNLDTFSSEMQRWSRQRRHGSASRRLFARESTNNVDFASEKFYFLLAEKYSKLNMLLKAIKNVKDSVVTSESWMRMNAVVSSVEEALQKVHVAKENAKNLPSTICEKCIMLELFMDLKACHKEADVCDGNLPAEKGILIEFETEVYLLKEACKEPFSLLSESVVKRSRSTQSESASDNEQAVISELKKAYIDLNAENEHLNKNFGEVKRLLSKEKETLKSVKSENRELSNQTNNLTEELLKMEQKGERLSARNEELARELKNINRKNLELTSTLTDLEKKKKRSSITMDELTEELQLNKSDLVDSEKLKICELEDALVDLNDKNKNLSKSLEEVKTFLMAEKEKLESAKSENFKLCNQINNLKNELLESKQQSYKNEELANELKDLRRKNLDLKFYQDELEEKKKETSVALEMFKSAKSKNLELHNQISNLKRELLDLKQKELSSETLKLAEKSTSMTGKSMKQDSSVKDIEESCTAGEMIELLKSENLNMCNQINQLENELLDLKQKELLSTLKTEELSKDLSEVNRKNSDLCSSLKDFQMKIELSKKELDQVTGEMQKNKLNLDTEKIKISELENVIVDLNDKNKNLNKTLEEVKIFLMEEKEKLELAESKNLKLCKQINNLKKELFETKQQETYKNEELTKQLEDLRRKNSELNSNHNEFEEKKKETNVALEMLQSKNSELFNQINNLKREILDLKQKELASETIKLVEKSTSMTGISMDLNSSVKDVKMSCTAREMIESLKSENLDMCKQINNLKNELLDLKQKEFISTSKTEELSEELTRVNRKNSDLSSSLNDLQMKIKLSNTELDQVTGEMKKYKLELDADKIKIRELEDVIVDLNYKNKNLNKNLEEVKKLLSEDRNMLRLAKSENLDLSKEISNLKEELFGMQQKEKHLSLQNQEIVEELKSVNRYNCELNSTLKDLEEKRKESSVTLDQLTTELQNNKLVLVSMNEKCLEHEKKLNEQISRRKEYEEKLKYLELTSKGEKEILSNKIHDLGIEKNNYQEELESIKNAKLSLEKENASLQSKCNELSSLQETINDLLKSKETLSSKCTHLEIELENTRKNWQSLQKKFSMHEKEVLMKFKANEEEYCQQLKDLETKSLNEKEKLLAEISKLTLERKDILEKLNAEKVCYERLIIEKEELNQKVTESCEQISSLQLLNEELKIKQQKLLQRKEFFEKASNSSNIECDNLNKDLKCMRETLQNLESKCMRYEKEIVATAGMKDNLIECLLNITHEFSTQTQKLNELCKAYGKESNEDWEETSVSESIPVIDDDNVNRLCSNLCIESKRLMQSVNRMLELFKSFYLKSLEMENVEEKCNLKTASISKQMEFHKTEGDHLKSQNDQFQHIINELQKSILEKEKSIQCSACELQSLKEKIHNSQAEIEKGNELLKRKDEEVTKLQERVFNLQSYVNTIIADKTNVQPKSPPTKLSNTKADSVSSTSQLPSTSSYGQSNKSIQTIDYEDQSQGADESFISVGTLERDKNSCCEKYLKKYQSLLTKSSLFKKRIEILEKEKYDLREHYLNQIKTSSTSEDNEESGNTKLVDLESKLEQKKSFICELKSELLKTCNSLIDKEKEVDDLKEKLCESERKSKSSTSEIPVGSVGSPKTVDASIRKLKNYKWKLIQTIFDIQRTFYEKRGIHLNYIDKFRDHVNSLYSLQLSHSLSKSESMPLLESHHLNQLSYQGEDKLKSLVGLELDIECLENLKIFLNRFFVPSMLQTSQDLSGKVTSEKNLSLEPEMKKLETLGSLGISSPAFVSDHLAPEDKVSTEKNLSFENFVSNVSHYLDCFESLFTAIRKCQWLESLDLPAKKSVNKAEVRSLLLKIFEEIKNLEERADKLFSFNTLLKNLDFVITSFIPFHFSRPDMSDLESLMSEETIGISRSESPLSYEELCSSKLPCPETLTLKQQTLQSKAAGDKATVTQTYGAKVTTIGSSCDSVCQRSHYSSPDLGIESDPNHESSAPEQKEEGISMYQKIIVEEKKFFFKPQQKTAFTETESAGRFKGVQFTDSLFSIGKLPSYELLKREIQESLVGIKSVLSRTGDGLHHVAKYTSPRKTLEYSTLKAIKDSCANIEVCLKEAYSLIGEFWIAPCPSEKEWKALIEENQSLTKQLSNFRELIQKQEREYKKATKKLEQAQLVNTNMEKKISKKLVKTKKNIRQAELKLLGNMCQNLPPVPKYPFEQANLVPQTEDV